MGKKFISKIKCKSFQIHMIYQCKYDQLLAKHTIQGLNIYNMLLARRENNKDRCIQITTYQV
jgi:hypothetical protein